jgi:hypothetical protein
MAISRCDRSAKSGLYRSGAQGLRQALIERAIGLKLRRISVDFGV